MIEFIVFLAWLIPALAVFRRVGYSIETSLHQGHEYQSICSSCKCKNCRRSRGDHNYYSRCDNFEFSYKVPHLRTCLAGLATFALWPLILGGYATYSLGSKMGYTRPDFNFFVPPPSVESKQDKTERLLKESKAREVETNKRIAELEEAAGIR